MREFNILNVALLEECIKHCASILALYFMRDSLINLVAKYCQKYLRFGASLFTKVLRKVPGLISNNSHAMAHYQCPHFVFKKNHI